MKMTQAGGPCVPPVMMFREHSPGYRRGRQFHRSQKNKQENSVKVVGVEVGEAGLWEEMQRN